MSGRNIGASVYAKLKNLSREKGLDMQSLVRLYAQQRLLYRISVTPAGSDFCLKGGLMLAAYNNGDMLRPTEDIDFNGTGSGGVDRIEAVTRQAVGVEVPEDGVAFDASDMRILKDRDGIVPGGKVVLQGHVHTARVQVRVDVGFNNVITPAPSLMEIPTLLPDMVPRPVVPGYPLESIVSEKLHAIAQFGSDNTRHKDYYDIWRILETYEIDGASLREAIRNTFSFLRSEIDPDMSGLTTAFGAENERAWKAFLRKTNLSDDTQLVQVIDRMREFLVPAMEGQEAGTWTPGQGWSDLALRPAS